MTFQEFTKKATIVHNNQYTYQFIDNFSLNKKIAIFCKQHGCFYQTAKIHLYRKTGCRKCFDEKNKQRLKSTTNEFIQKAVKRHGNLYDYSLVQYQTAKTPVIIVCKKHGNFLQTPNDHLSGYGCPSCGVQKRSEKRKITTEQFISKSCLIHGSLYSYEKTNYIDNKTYVEIICKKHGSFFQTPNSHLNGNGCPKCKLSKGELSILKWLEANNIFYFSQFHIFQYPKIVFDFYIPSKRLFIEFDGEQHYQVNRLFHKNDINNLLKQQQRDYIKQQFVNDSNQKMLKIKWFEIKQIPKILQREIYGC